MLRRMIHRLRALILFAAFVVLSVRFSHADACPTPIVVRGPVVIAFFDATPRQGEEGEGYDEALADFEFYARSVREPLKKLGIDFCEVYTKSLRVRIGGQNRMFATAKLGVGYYLIARGRKPRLLRGVETDAELIEQAKNYFAPHSKPLTTRMPRVPSTE